ncbi:glycine-rich domain-containing protein-like [Sorangium sp. So ce327]|uniref:glycine-rich domain-containing protein n=1 Tax=Sorangium sp. So ce327 TaxID=3133301 RepID=UPI003F611F3D
MHDSRNPATTSIITVDLVKAALRSEELGHLPLAELARDARDYERFLLLAQRHPDEPLAPTRAIDRMWHLHMQHPRAYAVDCTRLFGELLDHDGGFGSDPDQEPMLRSTFERTAALWQSEFGEVYGGRSVACKRNCVSRCQRKCKTIAPAEPRPASDCRA